MLDDLDSARGALTTAQGLLNPPVDKFLSFSAASIQAKEKDIDAAYASLEDAREVMEQFQLKTLEAVARLVQALISEAEGDYVAVADNYLQAIEKIEHTVGSAELQAALPQIFSELANAQIKTDQLDAAEKSINAGFLLDQSEPTLWVAKARLQQVRNMPQMALASVNYALAIWKDADENYVMVKKARVLAAELQSTSQ
jgi:tetratricopeptide (TPR) repeat protein